MVLPSGLPCVRHTAHDGAEHEGRDEGEEDQVDETFQSVVAHARHGLDVVLPGRMTGDSVEVKTAPTERKTLLRVQRVETKTKQK